MKTVTKYWQKQRRRLAILGGGLALTCGLPLASMAQTPGAGPAGNNANSNASANGGNLGQGAAPLPEPSTWITMGSLVALVAAVALARKRAARA
jgi:hypothetical protein